MTIDYSFIHIQCFPDERYKCTYAISYRKTRIYNTRHDVTVRTPYAHTKRSTPITDKHTN